MSAAHGLVVPPGGGKHLDMNAPGRFAALKLLGHETNDSIMLFEETVPAGTKSLFHLHHDSDEVAWVLAGEITFKIGDEVSVGGPGTCAFFPRGEGQSEVAAGSGRSCENTIAFPTCTLIETALAGGTVAREIIRAGLSEHRTRTSHIDLEFTKGWVWGAAGPVDLPAVSQDRHPGRKERLRANP